jgi:hypothetical protein
LFSVLSLGLAITASILSEGIAAPASIIGLISHNWGAVKAVKHTSLQIQETSEYCEDEKNRKNDALKEAEVCLTTIMCHCFKKQFFFFTEVSDSLSVQCQ